MVRKFGLAMIVACVLAGCFGATTVKATVLTSYSTVTAQGGGSCGTGTIWTIDAYDDEQNLASDHRYGWSGVTHNQNGTVTITLADIKADVGSANVTLHVFYKECGTGGSNWMTESTVVILD